MTKTVLTFGIISGFIATAMMFLTLPLMHSGKINFDNGYVLGYTTIVLSLLLVFFGIRSYREQNGGTISFGRAFTVGILITLISCVFYVVSWEIIYFNFMPDFAHQYTEHLIASKRAKGASDAEIAATLKQEKEIKAIYDNPLTNAAFTFIEPFPVGLIMTLVSAGILRRRSPAVASSPTAA